MACALCARIIGRSSSESIFQEPIKEAGILEGRNGIKETCLQVSCH